MSFVAQRMVSSGERPVPLRARPDLISEKVSFQGNECWVVKDPVALRYLRLEPEQFFLLQQLDGERSLKELLTLLRREFPSFRFEISYLQSLVTDLHRRGLVYSDRFDQGLQLSEQDTERRRKRRFAQVRNPLYIRLPGWDPERTLQRLYPWLRWAFRPWAVVAAVLFVVSSWGLLLTRFDEFQQRLPEFSQFFGWPNVVFLWLALAGAKVIHEFGHGLACKHFGGECHEMGVLLLVFSPCLYCDVSDSWLLPSKWARIAIGGAGMYIEVLLSAVAIWIWWFTADGLLHHLALSVFFVTTLTTVIFNANPLMRFDGYYMLSDLLEIPNLRPQSEKMLWRNFAWHCLGIKLPADPFLPQTGKVGFTLFAIAAALYRYVVLVVIVLFLYTVLKPYNLQSIGIALAVFSVGTIVFNAAAKFVQILRTPRSEPMSAKRIMMTSAAVAALVMASLMVPVPNNVQAVCLIQPHDVRHVYTQVPGRLTELLVRPGDTVSEGQVLARLVDIDAEQQRQRAEQAVRLAEIDVELFRSLQEPEREQLARTQLHTAAEQLEHLRDRMQRLTITAPTDGLVLAPPPLAVPTLEQTRLRLAGWDGTPLEARNIGCFLPRSTHLLSLAPTEQFQAKLFVDQADRPAVAVGQRVELKLPHLPSEVYEGRISQISRRQTELVPGALSNKRGGDVPTVTDPRGREQWMGVAYEATVTFDADPHMQRSGLRGRARIVGRRRTVAEIAWTYLCRTFRLRL